MAIAQVVRNQDSCGLAAIRAGLCTTLPMRPIRTAQSLPVSLDAKEGLVMAQTCRRVTHGSKQFRPPVPPFCQAPRIRNPCRKSFTSFITLAAEGSAFVVLKYRATLAAACRCLCPGEAHLSLFARQIARNYSITDGAEMGSPPLLTALRTFKCNGSLAPPVAGGRVFRNGRGFVTFFRLQ
ncbi:hypothetical protein EJ03DRAFT_162237 [Teratosphaeria nubilosa]|uniref:Uncharacterized protein n=1 Tax=Teratosphaeria nubilosa TaxID=161662 RepID=A0A6G1L2P9_9PEZI|nr:hypothetical protein EJ03DRAFT_162237 [Teratosphaeria nubilosa]